MNYAPAIIIGAIVVALLGGVVWWNNARTSDPSIISLQGIHWHPMLTIYVKGEKVAIPEEMATTPVMHGVHTHKDLPIIHLEFSGTVRTEDTMLGQFFKSWNKDFYSFGQNVRMTVNGKENTDYERYPMKDGDIIELRYD